MPYHYGPQIVIPNPQGTPANGNSMATNITSSPTIVQDMYAMSYALVWTGVTPIGTVSIQGSNDFSLNAEGQVANPGTWNTMTVNYGGAAVTVIPVTGNTGNGLIDIVATGIYAIRLIYSATSGTGTMIVTMNAKDS
jgi:hypothetical protein